MCDCATFNEAIHTVRYDTTPILRPLDRLSRGKLKPTPQNPAGFADRLKVLMDGWGFTGARPLAELAGVSHGTIANWLAGKSRANIDEVGKVARVFGWTAESLYYGVAPADIMDRVAELEAFKTRVTATVTGIPAAHPPTVMESLGEASQTSSGASAAGEHRRK